MTAKQKNIRKLIVLCALTLLAAIAYMVVEPNLSRTFFIFSKSGSKISAVIMA